MPRVLIGIAEQAPLMSEPSQLAHRVDRFDARPDAILVEKDVA